MGSTDPICISPIHSDQQNTAENEAGSSVGSMFDHTTVESTAMVSFGTGNVHRFPSADSDEGRYVWNCWCNQRNYDPISAPVEAVLEFLTEEFHKGKQYSTLNSYRSSISMTYVGVKGIPVGKLPIVSRFMKGIFNLRPPCLRYTSSWDVSAVLDFITAQGEMNHFH